jgi:eukaryotic-like serine/threonine-protein kinase
MSEITRLENYELLAELASGGMASVYIARQTGIARTERLVVVKRVHPHLLRMPKFREMFHDEARVASLVQHPNVARLLDVLDHDGELLIVLEYIESVSLSALQHSLREKGERLAPAVAVRIVSDVLEGLQAAHDAKDLRGEPLEIVHRDVSPQNIVVGTDGRSRLIDFGIAKASARLTETTGGNIKGKLSYMSPEQAKASDVDRRSDLFSAGIVLHEALTGKRLFQADGTADGSHVLLKILLDVIEPPSSIAPDVPVALDAVVEKSLERVRDERYQSAAEFRNALVATQAPAAIEEVAREVERVAGPTLAARREELSLILKGVQTPNVTLAEKSKLAILPAEQTQSTVPGFSDVSRPVPTRSSSQRRFGLLALVAVSLVGIFFAVRAEQHRAASTPNVASVATTAPSDSHSEPATISAPTSAAASASASNDVALTTAPSQTSTSKQHRVPYHVLAAPPKSSGPPPEIQSPVTAPAATKSDLHGENPY